MGAIEVGDVSIQLGGASQSWCSGLNMTPSYINFSGRKTLVQAYQEEGSCNVCRFGNEMLKCNPRCLDLCSVAIELFGRKGLILNTQRKGNSSEITLGREGKVCNKGTVEPMWDPQEVKCEGTHLASRILRESSVSTATNRLELAQGWACWQSSRSLALPLPWTQILIPPLPSYELLAFHCQVSASLHGKGRSV